jgi:hypothetical protein
MSHDMQYGIDNLGTYRTRNKNVPSYLKMLDRPVTKPMVDHFLLEEVQQLGISLEIEKENKSVTEPEWFWKGLNRYACPVHELGTYMAGVFCSCGRRRSSTSTGATGRKSVVQTTGIAGDTRTERAGTSAPAIHVGLRDDVRSNTSENRGGGTTNRSRTGTRPNGARYRRAVSAVRRLVLSAAGTVLPLEVDAVVDNYLRGPAASGLPYLGHNDDPGQKDRARVLASHVVAGKRSLDPFLGGHRVQPGDGAPKTRLVWMAPLVTTVVGGMFSIPLQTSLRKARPFQWGYSTLERGALISELDGRFRYIYGTDFSKFDACVPAFILKDVFAMIRETFVMDESLGLVWEMLVRDFIHTRIVGPDGDIYQKHHGIPSGSAFTSLVGSIVNLIVTEYIWIGVTGQELSFNAIFVMGDDALIGSERYITPKVMSKFATELGFTLNPDKTGVTSGAGLRTKMEEWPHFLGHYWVNGVPQRPEREVARAMACPERHRPQSRSLSDQRKAGYAMTTRQGFRMVMGLERDPRIFTAAAAIMRRASLGGPVNPINLPGTLRQRVLVEGEDMSFSEGNPRVVLLSPLY